jgi:hypothetical protein
MRIRIVLIGFLLFGLKGCGFLSSDLNLFKSGKAPVYVSNEERSAMQKAQILIGKTREEVIKAFGPNIRASNRESIVINKYIPGYNDLHPLLKQKFIKKIGIDSYYKVDESLYYIYDAGTPLIMPDQYRVQFYFIDNICVHVSG